MLAMRLWLFGGPRCPSGFWIERAELVNVLAISTNNDQRDERQSNRLKTLRGLSTVSSPCLVVRALKVPIHLCHSSGNAPLGRGMNWSLVNSHESSIYRPELNELLVLKCFRHLQWTS